MLLPFMNHSFNSLSILLALYCSSVMADQSIDLFDGRTLDGWVTLDDKPIVRGWEVADGNLHMKAGRPRPGHIKTTHEFENFELEFEWPGKSKWGPKSSIPWPRLSSRSRQRRRSPSKREAPPSVRSHVGGFQALGALPRIRLFLLPLRVLCN